MNQCAKISMESRDILTYPYSDPNPVPVITEGLGAVYPFITEGRGEIYPYHSFTGYSLTGQMQKWDVIKLENDYIEVYVLPAVGGKVWGAIEKSTGKEFIYRNDVMKFRNISQRGPWTSGGIEFNFGFIGHHPGTCVPVDYKTAENSDGSVSCIVGGLDLPSRTNWHVEIRLPVDKAYFETRVMWNNPTPVPQSYYNWMTAAAVVSDDLEFIYPGNQELGHDGTAGPWPVDREGRDLSWYANNAFGSDRSSHMVGEYNHFLGGYYHNSEFGFGHWALYDEMPGHKLWLWSQARSSAIWEDLLTDTNGQYLEFQAGRLFSQYSPLPALKSPITQVPFAPGITDRWNEIWFPVKEIGGFVDASPMGILNVAHSDGTLHVGIHALAFTRSTVTVRSCGKIICTETRDFMPMEINHITVPLKAGENYEVNVAGMDLHFNPDKRNLINRPFVSTMPTHLTTAASLYQDGMEQKEARNYTAAKDLFIKCLDRDPLYTDALAAMIELSYRSNKYDLGLFYANRALQLDTYHPGANYYAGITYRNRGDLINALETLGWAARSLEFRSSAYAQMAGIQMQLDNSGLAEHYAKQALDYNRFNFNAYQVLSVLYRKSGETDLADCIHDTMCKIAPLDHFADFEHYLLHPSEKDLLRFTSSIRNELAYQTYLEICLVYYGLGLKTEARRVLDFAPANPLITLWKAYLGNDSALLDKITEESAAYVFPYRTETAKALTWAVSVNRNWKFKYYLAINYWAIQREEEAGQLLESCGQEPDFAPFYLTRAFLLNSNDEKAQLRDLEAARKYAPDDWRTLHKLVKHYEKYRKHHLALTVSSAGFRQFKGNSAIGLQYAKVLLNTGNYTDCIEVLHGLQVIPAEGSNPGKTIYEQAYLLFALDLILNKKYAEAMEKLGKAREWPESLGVGMPYEPDNRIEDYLSALCLNKLNKPLEAAVFQNLVIEFTESHSQSDQINNLLALLIYKDKGEIDLAEKLIQRIIAPVDPPSTLQEWITAIYRDDTRLSRELEKDLDGINYFVIIKRIAEL
jgi:hypothetical protein